MPGGALQEKHAPEVHAKRINAKEVMVVRDRDKFIFLMGNGMIKLEICFCRTTTCDGSEE